MTRDIWRVDVTLPTGANLYAIVLGDSFREVYNELKTYVKEQFGLEVADISGNVIFSRIDVPSNPAPDPIRWVSPEVWPNVPAG